MYPDAVPDLHLWLATHRWTLSDRLGGGKDACYSAPMLLAIMACVRGPYIPSPSRQRGDEGRLETVGGSIVLPVCQRMAVLSVHCAACRAGAVSLPRSAARCAPIWPGIIPALKQHNSLRIKYITLIASYSDASPKMSDASCC